MHWHKVPSGDFGMGFGLAELEGSNEKSGVIEI